MKKGRVETLSPIQSRRYCEGDRTNNLIAGVRFTLEFKKKNARLWWKLSKLNYTLYW